MEILDFLSPKANLPGIACSVDLDFAQQIIRCRYDSVRNYIKRRVSQLTIAVEVVTDVFPGVKQILHP